MPQAVDDCTKPPPAHLSNLGAVVDGPFVQECFARPENL